MNKSDLIEAVAGQLDTSKADAGRAVEAVIESITAGLQNGGKVTIAGFGTFTRKRRPARSGINPITRQPMTIEASTTCGFRPAPGLKGAL